MRSIACVLFCLIVAHGAHAAEAVIHSFLLGNGGNEPRGGLIVGPGGILYGTTENGGPANAGTVFSLAPPAAGETAWRYSVLHAFRGGTDAETPLGTLTLDASGALYGTTEFGGHPGCFSVGCGTVFRLAPPKAGETAWTESVLYRFTGGADGGVPFAGVTLDRATGVLYGTTTYTGNVTFGNVYRLSPPKTGPGPWVETVLHTFTGGAEDGDAPLAGVILGDGALLGTTNYGGSTGCGETGCGIVYYLAPTASGPWREIILYRFRGGTDGAEPNAPLVFDPHGHLWGTTTYGGRASCFVLGCGTVFRLVRPAAGQMQWTEQVLWRFTGGADGGYPEAGVRTDPVTGAVFGTTQGGGFAGHGIVFRLAPNGAGWAETLIHTFSGAPDGSHPASAVVLGAARLLYGTTEAGGITDQGAIYAVAP